MLSPNVNNTTMREIHSVTNMKVVHNLRKYLRLPSHFSRSKCGDLNYIKERLFKRLLLAGRVALSRLEGERSLLTSLLKQFQHMSCFVFKFQHRCVIT